MVHFLRIHPSSIYLRNSYYSSEESCGERGRMIILRDFLKALELAYTPYGGHHAITYTRIGSKKTGWQDKLGLHIRLKNGDIQTLFLEQSDFEKDENTLLKEILVLIKKPNIGMGKPKGGEFERQVGYKLSLWLSKGTRKDLLCRTVGSGAQFTSANLRNQTAGIPGDLRSQDPLADTFCSKFVIECKHWEDLQILHFLRREGELYKALEKVRGEAAQLNKKFMLIAKQNYQSILLFMSREPSIMTHYHLLFENKVVMCELDELLNTTTPEVFLGDTTLQSTNDSNIRE
jgi:hypothetical protein